MWRWCGARVRYAHDVPPPRGHPPSAVPPPFRGASLRVYDVPLTSYGVLELFVTWWFGFLLVVFVAGSVCPYAQALMLEERLCDTLDASAIRKQPVKHISVTQKKLRECPPAHSISPPCIRMLQFCRLWVC